MEKQDYKLKIFLWDQFIRPLKKLVSRHTLQSVLIALVILNFVTFNFIAFFWASITIILIISIIDIREYWKSGKYISHYRQEKYPDYRKVIKEIKKKKEIPKQEIQIENVEGEVKAENIIQELNDEENGTDIESK